VSLHLSGSPEAVATQFVVGMETIRREQIGPPTRSRDSTARLVAEGEIPLIPPMPSTATPNVGPESRGLAVFGATTFDTVEGGERAEEVRAFLRAAAGQLVRRESYVGALRTAGAIADRGAGAGGWLARRTAEGSSSEPVLASYAVRAGFTDVGTVLVGFVPWVAR